MNMYKGLTSAGTIAIRRHEGIDYKTVMNFWRYFRHTNEHMKKTYGIPDFTYTELSSDEKKTYEECIRGYFTKYVELCTPEKYPILVFILPHGQVHIRRAQQKDKVDSHFLVLPMNKDVCNFSTLLHSYISIHKLKNNEVYGIAFLLPTNE